MRTALSLSLSWQVVRKGVWQDGAVGNSEKFVASHKNGRYIRQIWLGCIDIPPPGPHTVLVVKHNLGDDMVSTRVTNP